MTSKHLQRQLKRSDVTDAMQSGVFILFSLSFFVFSTSICITGVKLVNTTPSVLEKT